MAEEKTITVTPEEFKKLTDKLGSDANEQIKGLFEKANEGNKEAFKELKENYDKIKEIEGKGIVEYAKSMQEQLNLIEKEQKAMQNNPLNAKSFSEQLAEEVKKVHPDMIKNIKDKRAFSMDFKTVGDMSTSTSYTGNVIQPLYVPGVGNVPKRRTTLYDLLNKMPWATNTVTYVENSGGEGTIDAVSESGAFNQKDYDFIVRTMTLSKVAAYAKVTAEMMENTENVVTFIQNELVRDTLLALENDILTGNGSAPTMKGLQHSDHYTAAAIPSDYTLASGVTPVEADVLRACITQMLNGYMSPTAILMHPTDVMKMDLARTAYGYLMPPFTANGNTMVKGVPIIEHANITAGTFHVIDGTQIQLYIQRGLNLKLWDQNGNDPIYDLMTMTTSVKAGVLVPYNKKLANIYGNFATLIAAMTAGS